MGISKAGGSSNKTIPIGQALSLAEDFIKLFFKKIDLREFELLPRFFQANATFIFNGTPVQIKELCTFFLNLPKGKYNLQNLDAQQLPMPKVYVIQASGHVSEKGIIRPFFARFITMIDIDHKYKIAEANFKIKIIG